MTFVTAWVTSGAARPAACELPREPHALCAHLLPLRGSVRTLVSRMNVRALASLNMNGNMN
jgi:hypothetical protein